MQRADSIVLRIFLYGLPIVAIMAVCDSYLDYHTISSQPGFVRTLYDWAGFVFGLWMAFSLYLSARLIGSLPFRNRVLTKLSLFQESDEREVLLSGSATKTSFLTTLAILICFLCLSAFQVSVYHVPQSKAVDGKTGTISLGLSLGLAADAKPAVSAEEIDASKVHFVYSGFPVSKSAMILFLILWQIASYNFSIRRLMRRTA